MVETLSELLENAANVAENNTIDLSCEDFFKMKQFVQTGSKLQAIKHVKKSAKCGLKEAKDFVDTYCDYVL